MLTLLSPARTSRLRSLFVSPVTQVAVQRVSSAEYRLLQHLGDGYWWSVRYRHLTETGVLVHQLNTAVIGIPQVIVGHGSGSVVLTGTWTSAATAPAVPSGTAMRSTTAGNTAVYTSPAGTTSLGFSQVRLANGGGLATVAVDGDLTRATFLPTAQQVVDSGAYASTVLTTNGGTVLPTTRVIDSWVTAGTVAEQLVVADGLTAGVHTLTLTHTGYQRASGATDKRLYVAGFAAGSPSTLVTDAGVYVLSVFTVTSRNSAYEYAWETGGNFIGTLHGAETQDTLTFTMDGAPLSLADGQTAGGTSLRIDRTTRLHAYGTTTPDIANITTRYDLDRRGIRLRHDTTWLDSRSFTRGYGAMFPVHPASFSRTKTSRLASPITLVAGPGFYGVSKAQAAWLWSPGSRYGAAMFINSPRTVGSWAKSAPLDLWVQARDDETTNKVYATRVGSAATESVTPGTQWHTDVTFVVRRFPSDPSTMLAAA
jgi:hypothetical protein